MNKVISLFIMALLLIVASCSKEDQSLSSAIAGNFSTNKQPTGNSSNDLLSDKKYTSIVIEVAYVAGFEPSSAAINNFVTFVAARTNKPNGIRIQKQVIPPPANSTYTIEEIVRIEDANRTKYNNLDEIAVWAFFANGKSSQDTDTSVVLGTAYRNTSFVIFEQTIHGLSDSSFEPSRSLLETTVITHEFGHILGLTNLGTALQNNHEDTAHPKHCIDQKCLMYWSSETGGGIANMVSGGVAPQLDSQCIADLRANGGK